jgi:hypothetical protein
MVKVANIMQCISNAIYAAMSSFVTHHLYSQYLPVLPSIPSTSAVSVQMFLLVDALQNVPNVKQQARLAATLRIPGEEQRDLVHSLVP